MSSSKPMPHARIRVAAVIPAYNAAPFIGRAIASVQAQTAPVDEVIVVDDGSTDETCAAAIAAKPDIRLIRQANTGPSRARNRGVAQACTEFIAFLDADDEWLPDTIAALAGAFREHPEAALVTADMAAVDEAGRTVDPSWFRRQGCANEIARWSDAPVPNPLAALLRRNFVGTSVVMVRADAFRALGGFRDDLRYGEDLELWLRLALRYPIVCLSQVLGLRRSHPGNTTKATERLLVDLVRMSEIVRAWGYDALRAQGVDPDAMVARARTDLGYWYFMAGRRAQARATLLAALKDQPTARALRYLAAACLPAVAITGMRRLKEALHG